MNIGLDIDNVITSFDSAILQAFLQEDKNKRGKGIVNKKQTILLECLIGRRKKLINFSPTIWKILQKH